MIYNMQYKFEHHACVHDNFLLTFL